MEMIMSLSSSSVFFLLSILLLLPNPSSTLASSGQFIPFPEIDPDIGIRAVVLGGSVLTETTSTPLSNGRSTASSAGVDHLRFQHHINNHLRNLHCDGDEDPHCLLPPDPDQGWPDLPRRDPTIEATRRLIPLWSDHRQADPGNSGEIHLQPPSVGDDHCHLQPPDQLDLFCAGVNLTYALASRFNGDRRDPDTDFNGILRCLDPNSWPDPAAFRSKLRDPYSLFIFAIINSFILVGPQCDHSHILTPLTGTKKQLLVLAFDPRLLEGCQGLDREDDSLLDTLNIRSTSQLGFNSSSSQQQDQDRDADPCQCLYSSGIWNMSSDPSVIINILCAYSACELPLFSHHMFDEIPQPPPAPSLLAGLLQRPYPLPLHRQRVMMIALSNFYMKAVVPLYVVMILVKWWKIFSPDQCSGIDSFFVLSLTFRVPNQLIGSYLVYEEFFMSEYVREAIAIDDQQGDSLMTSRVDDVFFVLQISCRNRASIGGTPLMFAVRSGATRLMIHEY